LETIDGPYLPIKTTRFRFIDRTLAINAPQPCSDVLIVAIDGPRKAFDTPNARSKSLYDTADGPLPRFIGRTRCSDALHRCSDGPRFVSGGLHDGSVGRILASDAVRLRNI
jgi:hypothetical protein